MKFPRNDNEAETAEGTSDGVRPSSGAASRDVLQVLDRYNAINNRTSLRPRTLHLKRIFNCCFGQRRIPKGFCPPAQGCEQRATLGKNRANLDNPIGFVTVFVVFQGQNPVGVADSFLAFTQGSSLLATLGFVAESLWDSRSPDRFRIACKVQRPRAQRARTFGRRWNNSVRPVIGHCCA